MLVIKPVQEKSRQKEICEACGVEYFPESFAYSAVVDDVLTGICQFSMIKGYGELLTLRCVPGISDDEALFIMARAMMSFVEKCGIKEVVCTSDSADEKLIKQMGFKLTDEASGIYKAVLDEIFACRNHDK